MHTHTHTHTPMPPYTQSWASVRQIHAALQGKYASDHIAAACDPPAPDLLHNIEYKAAMEAAKQAALPDKGERPNRDPQVRTRI